MSFLHSPKIVTSGLQLYLDAGNTKSYSGSGTSWKDLNNNINNGILTNGPEYSSTNNGVINFNGVNNYVNISNQSSNNYANTTFTISTWIKTTTTQLSVIASKGGTTSGWNFGINDAGMVWVQVKNFQGYGVFAQSSAAIVNDNKGHNLVAVITTSTTIPNNNIATIFVDGIESSGNRDAYNIVYNPDTNPLQLGRRIDGILNYMGGISSIKIYNRALTATEVAQNFNATRGRFGI